MASSSNDMVSLLDYVKCASLVGARYAKAIR
jgi:hypothetical protein